MKKTTKKIISAILALTIIVTTLIIAPITSFAADSPVSLEKSYVSIWADPENYLSQFKVEQASSNNLATLGGIKPYKTSSNSSTYYWFLPSTADCSALKIWFAGTASINGTPLTSGEPTSVFADINEGGSMKTVTLTLNGTSYSVNVLKSGDVGTIYIDTSSGSLSKITSAQNAFGGADTSVFESGTIMVVQPDGTVDYCGIMDKMSGRGNGTWSTTNKKNPYNIKLAISTSLLGMNAAKKWCLLANVNDNTLVKNQLTYDFAKYIGIKYQPVCKPVDLYVNQQYLGSYQLSEKVEIKSNRINISDAYEGLEIANGTRDAETGAVVPADFTGTTADTYDPNGSTLYNSFKYEQASALDKIKMKKYESSFADFNVGSKAYSTSIKNNPTELTGGYLYELEISNRWIAENAGFCAYNRQGWVIKSCDYATKSMVDYSYDLLFALGASVYNNGVVPSGQTTTSCSTNPKSSVRTTTNPAPAEQYRGMKWSELLDADSAIRYYWTQEFFKNMDSSTSSTYFYKDADTINSKLYAGPMWDMDNSIGFDKSDSRWGYSWTSSDGWYTKEARMYRFFYDDATKTYKTDSKSPRNFYSALATNCSDFWTGAERYWFKYISPAVDIIKGEAVDNTGTLKSASEYINTVAKSGYMNAVRFDDSYNASNYINGMTNWFAERQTWVTNEISKSSINISTATIGSIPEQYYTGSEITPAPTVSTFVSGTGNITLDPEFDYTCTYSNNVNVGTASININGFGKYTGSVTKNFRIVKTPMYMCSAQIMDSAYTDMVLSAVVKNSAGNELTDSYTYQWNRNGAAISGATGETYTTTPDDAGSVITVTIIGDEVNLTGSCTSNGCTVLEGSRPTGYTQTIAAWNYDFTADNTALATADASGLTYYYTATSGENQADANLYASVDAINHSKIKWSGSDLYKNDSTSVASDQSPVMGTSKTDLIAWGMYPYFETVVSTRGFEGIKFSAKLGGTKKAPRSWQLEYSLDGTNYTPVGDAHTITANKTMELAFDNIALPSECNDKSTVYIRMVVCENKAINGTDTVVNQLSGDAAVNNIKVTGSSLSVVTSLLAPTVEPADNTTIFNDNNIVITDNNGGADVFYTLNGGEPVLYTAPFNPFDAKTSKIGDSVTITAYANFDTVTSETTTATYTFAGVNINSFGYETFSDDVSNGAVASTGGVYGKSGTMTAYTDGNAQYVPLWRDDKGSFCVSPDDGAKWSKDSGFTYKVSTAGYENIKFSCKAYTTAQGPKSLTLQYSTDGINFYNVESNVPLSANSELENLFTTKALPSACNNNRELYIRLATTENSTFAGAALHNNESKGNLYVNNVVISGEDDGTYKMPYTNKSTAFFGSSGTVKYYSPDGMPVQYAVYDVNDNLVQNGICPSSGIQLSTVKGFDPASQDPYRVLTWVEDDDDTSITNIKTYYYKGDTIAKFNYNDTTKPFTSYVSSDFLSVDSSSGAKGGMLEMYPNATDRATLSYTGTYGVKVAYNDANKFVASKKLNNPANNGYWLITTSTVGFRNLTLNLEQLSSNNGPRDWGVAYSTNGKNYTYVDNSNARAISNDASTSTVETYSNLILPDACSNQMLLYIKIFINGGESVDGDELEFLTKGNTGINQIELSGTPIPSQASIQATILQTKTSQSGYIGFEGVDIYVNGAYKGTTDENGSLSVYLASNKSYEITYSGDGIVDRTVVTNGTSISTPLLVFDVNDDGYINAKDYALINKDSRYSRAKQYFNNFINTNTSEFVYQ